MYRSVNQRISKPDTYIQVLFQFHLKIIYLYFENILISPISFKIKILQYIYCLLSRIYKLLIKPTKYNFIIKSYPLFQAINENFIQVRIGLLKTHINVISQRNSFYSTRKSLLTNKPCEMHCFNEEYEVENAELVIDHFRDQVKFQNVHLINKKMILTSKAPFELTDLFLHRLFHEPLKNQIHSPSKEFVDLFFDDFERFKKEAQRRFGAVDLRNLKVEEDFVDLQLFMVSIGVKSFCFVVVEPK